MLVAACAALPGEPVRAQPAAPVLLAAGDIADCTRGRPGDTAALLDTLPGEIALFGDITYPYGAAAEYTSCFGPTWGRHKPRLYPAPGNHDYYTPGALGYYGYFGDAATPRQPGCRENCQGYYAYTVGTWRIYALNSEVDMSAGSAQEQWLAADLAANPSACILAYWHRPRYSSGPHGGDVRSAAVWNVLAAARADVVLVGHDHHYERFAPLSPAGEPDPYQGIRQFIVGTGGASLREVDDPAPHSEVVRDDTWGILKLMLSPTAYAWEFVPIAGQSFADAGEGSCIGVTAAMTHQLYVPVLTGATAPGGPE